MMNERISSLRVALRSHGLAGFIQPRNDEFMGEYVPDSAARLAWLTGFTGSAGLAIVLAERAAVFSDGRYTLQLQTQTDGTVWERLHMIETPPQEWLEQAAPGGCIGYDPWLMSSAGLAKFSDAGLEMVPIANPIDPFWNDRPAPPMAAVRPHTEEFSGETAASKRRRIADVIARDGADAVLLTDPHAVAWLFNLRGNDLPHTPIALCFAVLNCDATATIFIEPDRISPQTQDHLGDAVAVVSREAMTSVLAALHGKRIRLDPATAPIQFVQALTEAGAVVVPGDDPCMMPRALKNAVEQDGARAAHVRDGIAMCRFLAWFAATAPGTLTEISAAAALRAFRAQSPEFRAESFNPISGAGEHGAIIHYSVDEASNRTIGGNEVYLIDSGGQYPDGTTDITRTLWSGPDEPPAVIKDRYTRVLAGHIAVAAAHVPVGTIGVQLDSLARAPLWQAGLDYDHGTGHGVGSYLSVHEGPVGLSKLAKPIPLAPGMILSDEPGYYEAGAFGIRLENLLLVVESAEGVSKPFLGFETLTLAPFERALIDRALLDRQAIDWIDAYHARILSMIGPLLDATTHDWLREACAPL